MCHCASCARVTQLALNYRLDAAPASPRPWRRARRAALATKKNLVLFAKKEQDGDGDGGGGGGGGGGKCSKGSDDSLTSAASKGERDKARKKSGTAPPPKVMYNNYSNQYAASKGKWVQALLSSSLSWCVCVHRRPATHGLILLSITCIIPPSLLQCVCTEGTRLIACRRLLRV